MWQSREVSTPFDSVTEWLTVPDIAEMLHISIGKVHRMVEEHEIFTVRIEGVQKVPAELFVDGEPLSSIRGIYTVEDSIGVRPIDRLLAGRKAEVRRIAQSLAF